MSVPSPALELGAEVFPDRRVLIVDDDRDFAEALSDLLAANGFVAETAHDGDQAIECCRAFDPLVAIVDIRLGGESGLDVIERLVEARSGLLCIVATAYAEVDTAVEAVRRGAYDYLRKPLHSEQVMLVLGRAFERSRLEGEKRAAEEALRASEERFRATFEQAAVGIAHVSPDGRFLRVNEKLCGMLGYEAEELAARTFRDVTHPEDITAELDPRPAMLAGELATYSVEKRYLRKDGAVVWGNLTVSLVDDEAGEPTYFIAVIEDISERNRRERERHERETVLGHAAELADLGHWVWDNVADTCVFCSEKLAQIHGFATAEAYLSQAETRAGDTQLIHPEDRARYAAAEAEAYRTKSHFEAEYRIVLPDGEVRHMREVSELVRDADGTLIRTIGTTQDITAQEATEAAIRESEARIRLIADSLPVLIAYFDTEERYRFVNETWKRWNRLPASEGVGKLMSDVLTADHYESTRPHIERALSGTSQSFEQTVRYPDGRRRDIEVVFIPHHGPDGKVAGAFAMAHDVTERKQAEQALMESEERFRAFIEATPSAILIKDIEGRYILANKCWHDWFNPQGDEITGKTVVDFYSEGHAKEITAQDRQIVATGEISERELITPFADGSERPTLIQKFPIRDHDGNVIATGGINSDITEHKRTADQLRQAQKMEAVGQLTGGVSHDFNNLLAVILGNAELADSEFGEGGRLSEYLGAVGQAARRGAELTQRLLAFSRQQALRPKEVDLAALAGGMTELLRRTLGETIAIETHAAAETWKVRADPGQLENAVLNLAINARDAMPAGGRLRIEAWNATIDHDATATGPDLAPGDYVVLSVGDAGQGMPAEVVERAFDPFFTTKEVGKGSGLGLSMVYGFVKQSGGNVEIESEAGHGTTVRIYLPKAKGRLPHEEKSAPSGKLPRGRGETVLVVEDDAAVRRLVLGILDNLGYRAIEAEDGLSALALLEESPDVDLLFSDMVLPGGMTGLEIAAQARQSRPGIKVLFMTGYTENRAELADMGAALIEKPFRRAAVAEKVRAALDG